MLFNSFEYLVFFLAVLAVSWLTAGVLKIRIWIILLASYYFYSSNSNWYVLLIMSSTAIDYFAALGIDRAKNERGKKIWLSASIISNLSILGFFKYFNFFTDNISAIATDFGIKLSWVDLNIALPVGISFFTFQSMSYTIDVYRNKMPAERSFYKFAFFVAYFPQLIAGPIVRAKEFMPQIGQKPKLSYYDYEWAIYMIVSGLLKKIVLADTLAVYADIAFDKPEGISWVAAWVGIYAFTFQIYFDFSGYTDIARGCAKLMGYDLPKNFNLPYVATSITDFWRRWHMSLSSWLRDYLYISLGGNRMRTRFGVYRNLMITMLLGGLWHGAAWNFVIWGFLHGLLLSLERVFGVDRKKNDNPQKTPLHFFQRLFVFHIVVITWIVFRIESIDKLVILTKKLLFFNTQAVILEGYLVVAAIAVGSLAVQFTSERFTRLRPACEWPVLLKGPVYAIIILTVLVFNSGESTPFIYFKF